MICIESTFTRGYNLLNSAEGGVKTHTLLICCEPELSQLWAGESCIEMWQIHLQGLFIIHYAATSTMLRETMIQLQQQHVHPHINLKFLPITVYIPR